MAFTQTDLDAIDRAIAKGRLIVQYNDRKVQYRSMDELFKARTLIAQELARATGTRRRSRVRYIVPL